MAKKTLQVRFIEALKARGETQVKQTSKYAVFTKAGGGFYYLGFGGSLRFGNTVAGSIPVSQKFKLALLGEVS